MKLSFGSAFCSSFFAILASEIGDKTFFIAAILAMKQPRFQVFLGAFGALVLMNTLSALVGSVALSLIPVQWTYYTSIILFFITGLASLREAFKFKKDDEKEELEEVENECYASTENGKKFNRGLLLNTVILKAFTLTFVAEWGDRSQLVTVGLGAVQDVYGVMLGGVFGHALCTGAAVLGGKQIASHVEEHLIAGIGGVLFLVFGGMAMWNGPPV